MKKLNVVLAATATLLTLALAVEIGRIRWALHGAVNAVKATTSAGASSPAAGP